MHKLTVKQAAEALGVSPKTIRRRIGEGELSASKELRGKQEVVLIDGAELARYAEGANLRLSIDRVGQQPVGVDFSNGLEGAPVPPETNRAMMDKMGLLRSWSPNCGRHWMNPGGGRPGCRSAFKSQRRRLSVSGNEHRRNGNGSWS